MHIGWFTVDEIVEESVLRKKENGEMFWGLEEEFMEQMEVNLDSDITAILVQDFIPLYLNYYSELL